MAEAMVAVFMVVAADSAAADSTEAAQLFVAVDSMGAAQLSMAAAFAGVVPRFAVAESGWVEDTLSTPGRMSPVHLRGRASGVGGPMPSTTGNSTAARDLVPRAVSHVTR